MEKLKEQPNILSFDDSLGKAKELYKKHSEEIRMAEARPEDKEAMFGTHKAIPSFLEKIPKDVLSQYYFHGISRGEDLNQLAALIDVCGNHFLVGNFGKIGAGHLFEPILSGSAVIFSRPDEDFCVSDEKGETIKIGVNDKMYHKINIGGIILSPKWYSLQEELSQLFPNVTFIRANQIPDYFSKK